MKTSVALIFSLVLCSVAVGQPVSFDWAIIGNPGNLDNPNLINGHGPFGAVDYTYSISKYEVTNAQYVEFLNAVAVSDPNQLFSIQMESRTQGGIVRSGSPGNYLYSVKPDAVGLGPGGSDYTYGNKPAGSVSFFSAMRFVNWLENGQPSGEQGPGTTEDGVYAINDGLSETRAASAKYFLPTMDEWYKAGYHKNDGATDNYWTYATSTDIRPNNNLPSLDTGNSANFVEGESFSGDFSYTTGDVNYPSTDVGAYTLSVSPYGTHDQNGNNREWLEEMFVSNSRVSYGGNWSSLHLTLTAFVSGSPSTTAPSQGFRVASLIIPEPSSLLLAAMATVGLLVRSR